MKTIVLLLGFGVAAFALSPEDEAKVKDFAREFIKDRLKAPATAQFSKETLCAPVEGADFQEAAGTGPTPDCKIAETIGEGGRVSPGVVYRGSVDSQNSYGALVRTKFQIYISLSKGKLDASDAMDHVRLLNDGCVTMNDAHRTLGDGTKPENCRALYPSAYR